MDLNWPLMENNITEEDLNVLIDFLSIVDDFDRAFAECEKHGIEKGDQIWLDGFKMIMTPIKPIIRE